MGIVVHFFEPISRRRSMRAEIVVNYKHGDVVDALRRRFGPHDPEALRASELWREAPRSAEAGVTYAAITARGLIVMARSTYGKGEIYVESSSGRLRACSEQVWQAIREEGKRLEPKPLKPKLHSLELIDLPGDVVATASVGVEKVLRDQLLGAILTGAVTAIVLVVAVILDASENFLYGSITALSVAILSLLRLFWSSRRKELAWR
jgi:hypothetical protein